MSNFDILIIGSGLGGLLCGKVLSSEGFNVCILEQGKQIGGCLQNFSRQGHLFDTGVHYIGSFDEGETLHRCFNYFGLLDSIDYKRLDQDSFDTISFSGDPIEYKYSMGYNNFTDTLSRYFPKERDNIQQYCEILKDVNKSFPLNNLQIPPPFNSVNTKYITTSVGDFLQSITSNKKLQHVLAGTNMLYAGNPYQTPMYIHALINHSYIQGAYRLIGGSSQIANLLAQSIKDNGGTIITNQKVVKLHQGIDNLINKIETENGRIYTADRVISNVHPTITLEMLDLNKVRKAYRNRIAGLDNTTSVYGLYLVLKKQSLEYMNKNIYFFSHENVWPTESYRTDQWPSSLFFSSMAYSQTDTYAQTASILSMMDFSDVQQWEKTTIEKRGSDYKAFKEATAQSLLELAEKKIPGIKKAIDTYYTSTPLTYRDYTGTVGGSIYGIFRDCANYNKSYVSVKTKIPNLYFTGQNTNMHGVLGVVLSAILTSREFIGLKYLLNKINRY